MVLNLSTEGPNLSVFLFNDSIQSFELLSEYFYLALSISMKLLVVDLILAQLFAHFVILCKDILDLVLQFCKLTGRKA